MEDTLARALESACASLSRVSSQLGAESAAVSLDPARRSDYAYFWNSSGSRERELTGELVHRAQTVTIVFGFADGNPVIRRLPEVLAADLDLIALAFWSAHEVGKLRAELKAANARLAGRKLIERAKGVLQSERGISEESAYAYLRGQSRRRRITLAKLAEEVIRVHSGFDRRQIAGFTSAQAEGSVVRG